MFASFNFIYPIDCFQGAVVYAKRENPILGRLVDESGRWKMNEKAKALIILPTDYNNTTKQ